MIVGGVLVGGGKDLKFNFPKTKTIKIIEMTRKFVIVEWFIENEKQINKCYKNMLIELIDSEILVNKSYVVDRMKFINTIV